MSLVVAAVVAAVVTSVGYLVTRRRPAALAAGDAARGSDEATSKGTPVPGIALSLGDVISVDGVERWLAGAIVARERGRVVAALFLAPEGREVHAVAAFAEPRRDVFVLSPVQVACPGEPPATLEVGQQTYARRARLPLSLERLGQAFDPGESAIWATYEAGGQEVLLVLIGADKKVFAWAGRRFEEGQYDRLGPGG